MTSQPGLQTIAIHILPNLSKQRQPDNEIWSINGNNKRNIFLQKLLGKWGKETSSRPLFIFWKSLI